MTLGLTAGLCSTLVFFLYLADPASPAYTFSHPEFMWIYCVVPAYWLGRAWLLASRGAMHNGSGAVRAARQRVARAGCADDRGERRGTLVTNRLA